MSLLLAPYTHAMRLGQGFNSYTQQICIDDAVVVDEQRPENIVTNDGTTMRIMAQKNAVPSAWTRQREVITGKPATAVLVENAKKAKAEVAVIEAELADQAELVNAVSKGPELEATRKELDVKTEKDESSETKPASESDDKQSVASATEGKSSEHKDREEEPSTDKPVQPKGDDDEVDREAATANIQANAPEDDKVDHDAIAANLGTNAQKLAHKKPIKRSASHDRARQVLAAAPTGSPDRATIRAALAREIAPKPATSAKEEADYARRQEEETKLLAEQRHYQQELLQQQRKDEADRRAEEREEQRAIRAEKRAWDAKRREDARKAIENAANLKATSLADLEKIRAQNQFVERFNGMSEQTQKYDFDPTAPRGPSQTVTYTSRFVDRLSDVMDDMSVSGSLSIKAGKVGGSGKGSFVDSDKFKESDLNFYISVKVVNQTINFKDALVYNPLRSVDENNFREVYGDSFISGFMEGGEFNALVSMKILNKAKKTDIQAEAKIALTAGAVQVEAEANVGIARSNIETNTETTIQVSWSGGGHIKPMEQQWDIQSLMAAAARFPDLVADCPQRTYAILTKYDSLRSFVAEKPASYTPLQYENAQIYTNTLLDAFVGYKALYKRLGEQIFGVQGKTLEIMPWSDNEKEKVSTNSTAMATMGSKDEKTGFYPFKEIAANFEASVKGLSDARTAIRRQMARIVNEVDLIEKDPKLATDEDHAEPFQSPVAFEARIPKVEAPERFRVKSHPLSGRRIAAKPLSEAEQKKQIEEEERLAEGTPLYMLTDKLEADEKESFDNILGENPTLGGLFRASSAVGDNLRGDRFNNLDFLKHNWTIRSIRTEMANGALVYLAVSYENGLLVEKGLSRDKTRVKKFGPFLAGERINSASIEHGKQKGKDNETMPTQVLGIRLYTNRGRGLIARALRSEPGEKGIAIRDGVTYENVSVLFMDVPFNSGSVKGFFGRSDDSSDGKIYRLGIIWGRLPEVAADEVEVQFADTSDTIDREDLEETQQKLISAQKALDESRNQIAELQKIRDKTMAQIVEAQCGSFKADQNGWRPDANSSARCSVQFPHTCATVPKLLFGMSTADAEYKKPRCLSLAFPEVNAGGFSVQAAAFGGCRGYSIGCNWLTLPNDLHLETGMTNTYGAARPEYDNYSEHIFFSQSFDSPPKVCVWIQEFEWYGMDFMSIKCYAADVTANSFHLKIESWANRRFKNARVQYLAYPAEEDGRRVKSGRNIVVRSQKEVTNRAPFYGQPFKNTPKTFIAISEMDFGCDFNLRFHCSANAPNNRELEWNYGTWDDTNMDHGEVQWIAIE